MAGRISIKLILILSGVSSTLAWFFGFYLQNKPWDRHDWMTLKDKLKLQNITMELMADANLKIRQTLGIRDMYSYTTAFEVGTIIGKIREQYRHMIEAYRQMKDKFKGRSVNVPPAIRELKPIHFIVSMEIVWQIQRQIDKMVNILETTVDLTAKLKTKKPKWTEDFANTSDINIGDLEDLDEKQIGDLINKEDVVKPERMRAIHDEQQLKRRYRQQYLMRRLNLPINTTTTKKRFIDQWPVEDTWNLGPYDDIGNK